MAKEDTSTYAPDSQFGKSAAEKEERLDEQLRRGEDPRGRDEPPEERPRAGNKAQPS